MGGFTMFTIVVGLICVFIFLINLAPVQNSKYMEKAIAAKRERDVRIRELDAQGEVYCPRCLSTQITAKEKGFSAGKALVGSAFVGPVGLAAGGLGSKKVVRICLKCKNKF